MSMPQLQNLGLSGVAHCGVDVGGFFNDATGELLARWAEMGIFQPFVRFHSDEGHARAGAVVVRRAVGDALPRHAAPADAAAALPLRALRRGGPHRRADPAPAAVRAPRRRDDLHAPTTSSCAATRCSSPRSPAPASSTATSTCPPGTWVQWWTGERVEGPAHVLAHAPLGRPGALRPRQRRDPAVARARAHRRRARRADAADLRRRRARPRPSASCSRTRARATARAPAAPCAARSPAAPPRSRCRRARAASPRPATASSSSCAGCPRRRPSRSTAARTTPGATRTAPCSSTSPSAPEATEIVVR